MFLAGFRSFLVLITILSFVIMVSAVGPALAQQVGLDAAKKEGKVFVYGTIIPQVMKLIEAGFEAKYSVNIEYWRRRDQSDRSRPHRVARG